MILRPVALALVCAVAYAVLGNAVSHAPPHGIDVAGRAVAGEAPRIALVFTASCWWEALVALGVLIVIVAIRFPAWRARAWFAIPTTLVTWQISDALKNLFRRPRPDYWMLIRETSFSYSSGHAMFALLVYGAWAWFVWRSGLPRGVRLVLAPVLALWGCGVIWSRLALGAHYVSDLIGGLLLASAALAIAAAGRTAFSATRARRAR